MKLNVSHFLASYAIGGTLLLCRGDGTTLVVDAQTTTYPCPPAGSSTPIPGADGTTIRVPIISNPNGLCLLSRREVATGERRAPVARSYAGRAWERSAGLFAQTGSGVSVDCSQGSLTECDVALPLLEEAGMEYVLESYEYETSNEAEAARFLEQATFGSTRETISAMLSTNNDFPSWVESQLALPSTSHREFFRSHTNPKYEFPYIVGAVGPRPCEQNSRWRKYALTSRDQLRDRKTGWNKHLVVDLVDGRYVWRVDGHFRTVTADAPMLTDSSGSESVLELGVRYKIHHDNGSSWKSDCVGCEIIVDYNGEKLLKNPAVSIDDIEGDTSILPYSVVTLPEFKSTQLPTMESTDEYPLFDPWIKPHEHALLNTTNLEGGAECDGFPTFRQPFALDEGVDSPPGTFPAVFGKSLDVNSGEEVVFAYDPHLSLYENTVQNPLSDGGGQLVMDTQDLVAGQTVMCQNVKRSFLNEDGCKLSYQPNACTPGADPKKVIVIDEGTLFNINSEAGEMLYAVTDLPIAADVDAEGNPYLASPCASTLSRWVKDEGDATCANTADLGPETIKTFTDLISAKDTKPGDYFNPNVVDVMRQIRGCDPADASKLELGNVLVGDGTCWKHVHPFEFSVIDLAGADDRKYTLAGSKASFALNMDYFYNTIVNDANPFPVIGKLDDHVELNESTQSPLDDPVLQADHKSFDYNPARGPVLVCGSPNEVASDPFHGDRGFDVTTPEGTGYRVMSIWELAAQRHTTWTHVALHAEDQLRQKMAWSLSQIVSVGLPGSGMVFNEQTEHYLAFYDMFTNHAFGNYLDLMKEFSFNTIMGDWLSFHGNTCLQYNIEELGNGNFPDENFAREIMQLFSIGLYQMNMDGSKILRDNGLPKETYTIEDILSYARAWTGLVAPIKRGGVSTAGRNPNDFIIDPMEIVGSYRDKFPKTDVQGGYIGDSVALCEDLPTKHFLRKGATYHALGSKPVPELQTDSAYWTENPDFLRLQILPPSPLYAKLCAADIDGDCTFPTKVVLDENLVYDAVAMNGAEYEVDTIRTVQLLVGLSSPLYYEYIRQPCVELAFFNDGKKLTQGQIWSDSIIEPGFCGNPKLEIGSPMCMDSGWETNSKSGTIYCHYQGERVKYSSAETICAEQGKEQGHPWTIKEPRGGVCADGLKYGHFKTWANAGCEMQVKIDLSSGYIAIVNLLSPDNSGTSEVGQVADHVSPDTPYFFKSAWENGVYPGSLSECLALSSCKVHGDQYCICSIAVAESPVFTSANEISSIDQLKSALPVGAADPAAFEAGTFGSLGDCSIPGVTVYSKSGVSCSALSTDTVFAFEWKSKDFFLKNSESTVHISDGSFSFRNPVHFINLADSTKRDMHHETNSVLDSLFYHPTHPPFMATRLIQRFGISNPSPGLIERVATAYKLGSYDSGRFGSGKYGDLSALVAAILLDDETRQVVVDADPAHGHLREPLVKVLSFFRSMGVHFENPLHIPTILDTEEMIGQGSFESPSVFSFFLPEYTPSIKSLQSAGLVAPESMVLSGDNVLNLYEAIFGTVKFGITHCYSPTFENWRSNPPFDCANIEGDTSLSWASPDYWPSSTASVDDILNELDILLTSGRLGDKNRAIIKSIVEQEYNTGDVAKSVRIAQQLIFSTPEFHSTGVNRNRNDIRERTGYEQPPEAPYKAVVVLLMAGGADSFNLLVPIGECQSGDQYQEYVEARGQAHALPMFNLTTISASSSEQDCDVFGVNKAFGLLANLYGSNEALFFANTGTLGKKMTKHDDWNDETPIQLFAHNTMQHEFQRCDPYETNANTGVFGRILDKLKLQGYHTSANAGRGGSMGLTGDQQYNNPVNTISTKAPRTLNGDPTVENIYEVVKELNGIGESDNAVMSETWSSRVSTALFEHEQMQEIAGMPEFDITSYGDDGSYGHRSLGANLQAIAEFMKSRTFRKVNREIYFVEHGSYDHHSVNGVSEFFKQANDALDNFVTELKNQNLWKSTVIVMGSDFGRSMGPNSSGGSDHAWGGNYFMIGGSVKGGQILGRYPQPMSPDSDYWIGRGRLIPTTPWEAVWNGVAQWMGVHNEDDLDWALPNRQSFNKCDDLFFDTDLFTDGACTCTECAQVTLPPTSLPTAQPTHTPTSTPTSLPSAQPTHLPTSMPTTTQPTRSPVVPPPGVESAVKTVTPKGSSVTSFGCNSPRAGFLAQSIDETTEKNVCDRMPGELSGLVIVPSHGKISIVKGLRVYSQNNCPDCDVVSYILEGRIDPFSSWALIGEGIFDWKDVAMARNPRGETISSTYEDGDPDREFTKVDLSSNHMAVLEYKLTFTESRVPDRTYAYAEIELPGLLYTTQEPTSNPTDQPTPKPTDEPTLQQTLPPTVPPTPFPTPNPTTPQPTKVPSPTQPAAGVPVASVIDQASTITSFGCNGVITGRIFDRTTEKYVCDRRGLLSEPTGIIVTPSHGQATVVKSLRLYTHNNCPKCDAVDYIVEGRVDPLSPWVFIAEGDFDWKDSALGRNDRGQAVSSTFELGDENLEFEEVPFSSNVQAFLEYRLLFPTTRQAGSDYLQFAELELPGWLLDMMPGQDPTSNPTDQPTPKSTDQPTPQQTLPPTVPTHELTDSPTTEPIDSTSTLPLQDIGNNGVPAEVFPLGQCQGDCDNDGECQAGLICAQRGNYEPVLGCTGHETHKTNDYCYGRPHENYLWSVGNDGVPANSFPMNACEGDCDDDSDCAGDLECFKRGIRSHEPVPGCEGRGSGGEDYCYDPSL